MEGYFHDFLNGVGRKNWQNEILLYFANTELLEIDGRAS